MSETAPRGVRLVVTVLGRRNAGKSSLINLLTGEETAIVSDQPGTTTDPVARPYELLPLGPVTLYDTAGLDDEGELGRLRVKAARRVLNKTDLALLVVGEAGLGDCERDLVAELRALGVPCLAVFNKSDLALPAPADLAFCQAEGLPWETASASQGEGGDRVKQALIDLAPRELKDEPLLLGDLVGEGDLVLYVVPIDLAAPKGRLILPQVQVLRDALDRDALALAVKEREIEAALALCPRPALVVTDSQVVLKVAGDVPDDVPLTTFSILFARYKGDLTTLVQGAQALDRLQDGDRVLIAEACAHHVQADDIGRVKIPRWISRYAGRDLRFEVRAGADFPEDLEGYALAVHCGGCMLTRTEMLRRIKECRRRGVPVVNYGVAIAKTQGVLERTVRPFLGTWDSRGDPAAPATDRT